MYNRGKLIEIHRDWMKTWNSDVFCFGNFWRYIGMVLIWPIPMYVFIGFLKPVHRDGGLILDSDVSPSEIKVIIHRSVPNLVDSDVCGKK